jgi:MscS family membrane protein
VTVPNSRFISSHVDCLGARRERRVKFNLGLTYDTPAQSIEAFCEGVRELVRAHPYTAKDSYHVWFSNFGASSLDVEVICFIETTEFPTFVRERHRLFLDILRLAQRLGVGFAFPTTTVWMGRTEDLAPRGAGPVDRRAAIEHGRASAREVARESVGGLTGKPEPVQFVADDPDAIPR